MGIWRIFKKFKSLCVLCGESRSAIRITLFAECHIFYMFADENPCHIACFVPCRFAGHVVEDNRTVDAEVLEADVSYQAVAVVADDVRQFGMMKMGEYVALSNLRNGTDNQNNTGSWLVSATQMPFTTYEYSIDCSCRDKNHGATHTQMADDEGRGSVRPGWEILYNHYAKVANVGSGYTYAKQFADKLRPEGGVGEPENRYGTNSGAFDQLGWATLMLYRE